MVLCIVVGCGVKSGTSLNARFSRIPKIVKNEGQMMEELTTRRRRMWISAISRGDLTDDKLENERVCDKHFVSGQAAKNWDQFNIDWIPSLHLGHRKKPQLAGHQVQVNADRAERRKRRQEQIEIEIFQKMKKLNEPGKTVENIFNEVEHKHDSQLIDQFENDRDKMEIDDQVLDEPDDKIMKLDLTVEHDQGSSGKSFGVDVGSQTNMCAVAIKTQ